MPDDATAQTRSPIATAKPDVPTRDDAGAPRAMTDTVFGVQEMSFDYGSYRALRDVDLSIHEHQVTALIGPSGCGKSTFIRCLNRMNDLIPGTKVHGRIDYRGEDLYGGSVDPIEVRRRIGMVFQRPNPFPKSIYDNVAFGPRLNGVKRGDLDGVVESSLRSAALWEEVKDKLKQSAFALSGGQQQRLCIARAVAVRPDVVLMDEPCSALDPIATMRIEELINELKRDYTIVIVTHNMQQAARMSDRTAFFTADVHDGVRVGVLVEVDWTETIFTQPHDSRTEDYITGRFG